MSVRVTRREIQITKHSDVSVNLNDDRQIVIVQDDDQIMVDPVDLPDLLEALNEFRRENPAPDIPF